MTSKKLTIDLNHKTKENQKELDEKQEKTHELKSKVSHFHKTIKAENHKNREELIKQLQPLFSKIDNDLVANLTSSSLKTLINELKRCYKELKLTSLDEIKNYTGNGSMAYSDGILYINHEQFNTIVENPKKFFEKNVTELTKRKQIRHLAIDDPKNSKSYIFDHEFGHYIFLKYEKKQKNAKHKLIELKNQAQQNKDIEKISQYAKFDEYEFFAETYAMSKNNPCDLPDYLLDFVKEVQDDSNI